MKTLITCIHHPNFIDRQGHYVGLREHDEVAKVVVEASPRDVLHAVFPNCYVDSYRAFVPWMINCQDEHTYLSIEEAEEEYKFLRLMKLSDFLKNPDFNSSLRGYELGYGKFRLAESLVQGLDPYSERVFEGDGKACAEMLNELGFNMPIEKIREIVNSQVGNASMKFIREQQEHLARQNHGNCFNFPL